MRSFSLPIRPTSTHRFALYAIAALVAALIMYSGLIVRLSVDDGVRTGVPLASSRTDASDNYVYFSLLKRGINSCRPQGGATTEPLPGNPLACTYVGGLAFGNALWVISQWVSPSKRIAVSILLILNAAALAFAYLWALDAILRRHFPFIFATTLAVAMLVALDNFGLSFQLKRLDLDFRSVLSLEPGFARLVNPSLFWALGLATIALLFRQVQQGTPMGLTALLVLAVACGTAGLAVSACILAGCGLFVGLQLLRQRRIIWPVVITMVGLIVGLSFSYWKLHQFRSTDLGKALLHGQMLDVRLNWTMLWLAIPIAIGKIVPEDPGRNLLIKCLLVSAMIIGIVCDSFELGDRLWLRGSAAIAFVACAGWLLNIGTAFVRLLPVVPSRLAPDSRQRLWVGRLTSIPVLILLAFIGATVRAPQLDKARGFIDRDKLDVLTWLDGKTTSESLIASTSIEDSFLIEFYTNGRPFVPLYGLTALPREQQLGRYFQLLNLVREGDEIFQRLISVRRSALDEYNERLKLGFGTPPDHATYESLAFYHMLLYYPFSRDISGIFELDRSTPNFLRWLTGIRASSETEVGAFDYLILRSDEHLKQSNAALEAIFRNSSYVVLHSPRRAERVLNQRHPDPRAP